jgi:DNA-binding transcriptional LysR family regulator
MSLSFRQLQIISAVGRSGSVTGAAAALGISQPAVSMMLKDCARAAGFPLFVRRQGRLQPLAETRALLTDLERLFDSVDRINRQVDDMRTTAVGTIQIAATPTLADNLLPPAVALFQKTRPKVRITIHAMDSYNVVNHVVREYVDFGLALSPFANSDAREIELCAAELVCVVHPENALATRSSVSPADLAAHPLISFSKSLPLGVLVNEAFQSAGAAQRIALEVNQSSVACGLARAGAGVAIIDPFWLMGNPDPGLVHIKLRPRAEVRAQILVPKTAALSRTARLFVSTLRKTTDRWKQSQRR